MVSWISELQYSLLFLFKLAGRDPTVTPEERAALKAKIADTIEVTKNEIVRLKELSKPVSPDNAIGRITRMDAIQSKSMSEASLRKAEDKLVKLEAALEKINDAHFGTCIRCGNAIQTGRLLFMPESTLCIVCAGK